MTFKISELFKVEGLHAVVTGAASGLGLAIARALGENGARVVLVDVDASALASAEQALRAEGAQVWAEQLDVTDHPAVQALFERLAQRLGPIDVVFANAGIGGGAGWGSPEGALDAVPLENWHRIIDVNLHGAFATVQAAARVMRPRKQGSIILTASIAGLVHSAVPGYAYHVAKAGVVHLVRIAAKELGTYGVRINGIAPGPFVTNIGNGSMTNPDVLRRFIATNPMGRVAQAQEIAGIALLLASPASSYVNGVTIPVDGGDSA